MSDSKASLSEIRSRAARAGWSGGPVKPIVLAPIRAAQPALPMAMPPTPKPKPKPKPKSKPAPEIVHRDNSVEGQRAELRLIEVTNDAIASFNAILAKPHGLLARVSTIAIERRRNEVKASVRAVSRICKELYGDTVIPPKFWDQYFTECKRDDFLSGHAGGGNGHEKWMPDFEYLLKEKTIVKTFEKAMSR